MSVIKVLIVFIIYSILTVRTIPLQEENKASPKYLASNSTKNTSGVAIGDISKRNTSVELTPVKVIQGDCGELRRPIIYTENFLLENDKKSQVWATIRIGISGNPNITCVEVVSRSNDLERPKIIEGGIGHNFVVVAVNPGYGSGFNFSVKLYGSYNIKHNQQKKEENNHSQ